MNYLSRLARPIAFAAACLFAIGCASRPRPGDLLRRSGDEIVVCGQLFHTGAPVILWTDPGGYDAYRTEPRFPTTAPTTRAAMMQAHFNRRIESVAPEQWDLPRLQQTVDQFVIHYDACGSSRKCFEVLHDQRGLSVHFMLDTDGTIYQTLDLKERAWHATTSNSRSAGVEIANLGAFPQQDGKLGQQVVSGEVQGQMLYQSDFTPQQYASLIKLTAALCTVFPKIRCDYPHDAVGHVIPQKLPDEVLTNYQGVLGHYHVQANKQDPGPAFDWDRVINGARPLVRH
jgi:N-acetylmuramoyl-L-alanine amidase